MHISTYIALSSDGTVHNTNQETFGIMGHYNIPLCGSDGKHAANHVSCHQK